MLFCLFYFIFAFLVISIFLHGKKKSPPYTSQDLAHNLLNEVMDASTLIVCFKSSEEWVEEKRV